LTRDEKSDHTISVANTTAKELNEAQRHEVSAWIEAHQDSVPESVRIFLTAHQKYLKAGVDLGRRFEETVRELRRALGITPSSERRRSGNPLANVPRAGAQKGLSERERLEGQKERSEHLSQWHVGLGDRHTQQVERLEEKLEQMKRNQTQGVGEDKQAWEQEIDEDTPLEQFEPTEEQKAAAKAQSKAFVEHLEQGQGAEPEFESVNEALMPEGAVVNGKDLEQLTVEASEELGEATVVKTLTETRERYDISITVKRLELEVEKKVVVKGNGERTVMAASTDEYGPARYRVTWTALSTLAILACQFAMPLNRMATLFSCVGKRFTAGGLSRLLRYVATRLVPIYIELGEQLSDSEIIGGDDTSTRVLEVNTYFEQLKKAPGAVEKNKPPWVEYRTKADAVESIKRCEERKNERLQERANGERDAKRTPDEDPTLGMLIGRHFDFESSRQDGKGAKRTMNTTVLSGRTIAKDPRSLIIFYRSHLGSCGNLLESILQNRKPSAGDLIVQADLSTTNLIKDPELLKRFNFQLVGCSAHARRPFALYEHEDRMYCPYMLHLFKGPAIHEERLDVHGRNRENVLAVRQGDSLPVWEKIRELAAKMASKWSKATKLGTAARYILNHYDKLTAYLKDPRLEPTNNLRERMLRMEKLIENSSMFRRSLEGRFVLDIVRTVLQTAVAAGVPVNEYLTSVLKENPDEIAAHPERFTPLAWAKSRPPEKTNSN
jgi:hypothetical protein